MAVATSIGNAFSSSLAVTKPGGTCAKRLMCANCCLGVHLMESGQSRPCLNDY
jgi:hypothetical protein